MQEFKFLGYYTRYSATGVLKKSLSTNACFSDIYRNFKPHDLYNENYIIYIYKGTNNSRNNNMCFLNKKQLQNHIKQAKEIFDFKYQITENKKIYKVNLSIAKAPGNFHKYILAWIRYCYEFPYNMLLLDALEIKKEYCFKYTSISNLFNLVLSCFNEEWDYLREIHQIPKHQVCLFLRKKEVFKRLLLVTHINDIYKFRCSKKYYIPKKYNKYYYSDLEYWQDENCLDIRMDVYKKLYNSYIKKKK